ncbi:MAG: hypothetical protein WD512_02470, partial [Candidatus Paceibacterota bacterium]
MQAQQFTYLDYNTELTGEALIVRFNFSLDQLKFQELVSFPINATCNLDLAGLATSLSFLHLILGISYYKAAIPERIECQNYKLDATQVEFFEQTFFHGLQEFAYRNQLD